MKTLRFAALIFVIVLMILPSIAQSDLSNDYDWANGIRVSYPDEWEIVEEENGIHLRSEQTDIFFLFEPYEDEDDVEDALEGIFDATRNDDAIEFDSDNIFFGGLSNFSLTASYFYEDSLEGDSFQRALFAIPVEEAVIVQVAAVPLEGREIDELSIVLNILSSLDYSESRVSEETTSDNGGDGSYEWSNGLRVEYPSDEDLPWQIVEGVEDGDVVHIVNEVIDIAFYLYPVEDERETNRALAIRQTFATVSTKSFDEEGFFFLQLANDGEALGYLYEESADGADFEQTLIALQPDDSLVVVAVILPRANESVDEVGGMRQVYEILETLSLD
jgi:hypothetical protein